LFGERNQCGTEKLPATWPPTFRLKSICLPWPCVKSKEFAANIHTQAVLLGKVAGQIHEVAVKLSGNLRAGFAHLRGMKTSAGPHRAGSTKCPPAGEVNPAVGGVKAGPGFGRSDVGPLPGDTSDFRRAGRALLVNSVDAESFTADNRDILVGQYRPLDVTAKPFEAASCDTLQGTWKGWC
jgi:hypothetical protein